MSGWIVLMGLLCLLASAFGDEPTFKVPELAPPAVEPVALETLVSNDLWRSEDRELLLTFFAEHQTDLSDYDRVKVLLKAALPSRSNRWFGSSNPNFIQSGPVRPILDLAMKAARGAENADTMRVREARVNLAFQIHRYIGLREAINHDRFVNSTDMDEIAVLRQCGEFDQDNRERDRLAHYLKSEQETPTLLNEFFQHVFLQPGAAAPMSSSVADSIRVSAHLIPIEGAPRDVDEALVWLDENQVPALADLPFGDPHVIGTRVDISRVDYSLSAVHERHVKEFVSSDGFGETRESSFDPHHRYEDSSGDQWRVTQSQLVSFLDREEPLAYEGERRSLMMMPTEPEGPLESTERRMLNPYVDTSMAGLRTSHPTRPLTKRESIMLRRSLKTLKPFMITKEGRIDMVAPVLAQTSCVRCHDAALGEPLGAFSYLLERKGD